MARPGWRIVWPRHWVLHSLKRPCDKLQMRNCMVTHRCVFEACRDEYIEAELAKSKSVPKKAEDLRSEFQKELASLFEVPEHIQVWWSWSWL